MRYLAALIAVASLAGSFFVRTAGEVGFLLIVFLVTALVSLMGFVSNRVGAAAKSQVYLPTPEERALMQKRNERLKQDHAQRQAQARRPEPRPPGQGPEPPASA